MYHRVPLSVAFPEDPSDLAREALAALRPGEMYDGNKGKLEKCQYIAVPTGGERV